MLNQTIAVSVRVLRQIAHDKRFVGISFIMPVAVIYMMWIFFEAAGDAAVRSAETFIPPYSAFIVHFITYVLCAIVLVRERTANTLARMFISGYRRPSVIGGYLIAYTLIATIQSLIVLIGSNTLFELNYSLEIFIQLYVVIWLLAIVSISIGILVSNFARNEGQVFPFIPLVLMHSMFFSGMIISIEKMPEWASWFGGTSAMYYANETIQYIVRDLAPVGMPSPMGNTEGNALAVFGLMIYGVVVLSLAVLTLREQE
jgi:ABC-2 type transport system permease protein